MVFVVLQTDAGEIFLEGHTVKCPKKSFTLNWLTRVLRASGKESCSFLARVPFLQTSAYPIFWSVLQPLFSPLSSVRFLVFYMPIRARDTVFHSFHGKKKNSFSLNILLPHLLVFFYCSSIWITFSCDACIASFLALPSLELAQDFPLCC